MAVANLSDLFNIYDVLTSTKDDKTGSLTYQLGNASSGEVKSDGAESWAHFGLSSRPSEVQPNAEDAPQVIAIARSDRDLVIAERDVRCQAIYGNLKAGETCLYAGGKDGLGQARILLKADGSVNLYTKQGNLAANQGIGILMNAADDSITITNSKGVGIRISNDGVQIIGKGGAAGITISDKIDISSSNVSCPNLNVLGGLAVGSGGLNVGGPTTLAALNAGATTTAALTASHIAGPSIIAGTPSSVDGAVMPGPITLS